MSSRVNSSQLANVLSTRATKFLAYAQETILEIRKPKASWVTFTLLFLTLFILDASVEAANWVETPSLGTVTFISLIVAVLLSRSRSHPVFLHTTGLLLWGIMTILFSTALIEPVQDSSPFNELFTRLRVWLDAAFNGGINNDTLPFGVILIAGAWMISYASAWFVFRTGNVWGGVLPSGLAILTNLSYLPSRFFIFFFLYVLMALLLIVWIHSVKREETKKNDGFTQSWQVNYVSLMHALWLGIFILVIASLLPLRALISEPLRRGYDRIHSPIEAVQDHFSRLFSSVPGHKDTGFQIFGSALPFQGSLSLKDMVIFTAKSQYPTYWAARSYDTYTSQGWPDTKPEKQPWGWKSHGPQSELTQGRMQISQNLVMNFDTNTIFYGGIPESLDQDANVLVPREQIYDIGIDNISGNELLPLDIRQWAKEVRYARAQNPDIDNFRTALAPLLLSGFPDDTLLVGAIFKTTEGRTRSLVFAKSEDTAASLSQLGPAEQLLRTDGQVLSLTLKRTQPSPIDIIALESSTRMNAGTSYPIMVSISIASEDQLIHAGTDYPKWVTDRYLQLPNTLPRRISGLAREIAQGSPTPYEAASRVTSYLRENYEYSTSINAPPYNIDGVDHFLYSQRQGHSEYFASAMAVIMRSLGIPTRMVAGYGMGFWDPAQEMIVIRDNDRHVWPEVFFPNYGWVIFEPTPIYEPLRRGKPLPLGEEMELAQTDVPNSCEGLTFTECEDILRGALEQLPDVEGVDVVSGRWGLLSSVFVILFAFSGAVLVVYLVWRQATRALGDPERAYEQMRRFATLAHLGPELGHTPYEFGRDLGKRLSSVQRYVAFICHCYVRVKYGREKLALNEQILLDDAWGRVRAQVIRQVVRIGGK